MLIIALKQPTLFSVTYIFSLKFMEIFDCSNYTGTVKNRGWIKCDCLFLCIVCMCRIATIYSPKSLINCLSHSAPICCVRVSSVLIFIHYTVIALSLSYYPYESQIKLVRNMILCTQNHQLVQPFALLSVSRQPIVLKT